MDEIIIRIAQPKDIEEICQIQHSSVHALKGRLYTIEILNAWAERMIPEVVQKGMETPEMRGFVAELNGKVVGFALLHDSSVRAIYVHPDFQKKGIGSRLLAHLEEEASSKGLHSLQLESSLNARSFYESHGYRVIKETKFSLSEELSMDSLEMVKDIS